MALARRAALDARDVLDLLPEELVDALGSPLDHRVRRELVRKAKCRVVGHVARHEEALDVPCGKDLRHDCRSAAVELLNVEKELRDLGGERHRSVCERIASALRALLRFDLCEERSVLMVSCDTQ